MVTASWESSFGTKLGSGGLNVPPGDDVAVAVLAAVVSPPVAGAPGLGAVQLANATRVERRTAPPNIRALVPRVVVTSACHRACGPVCDASWGSHRSCSRTACTSPHPVGVDLTSYWGRGWWTGGRRAAADAREARTGCCPDHRPRR